jgi:uncharacterized protein (DUF924 family)
VNPGADDALAQRVLAFWFDGPDGTSRGRVRGEWFGKDPAFDDEIRRSFGALIERALAGECNRWALDAGTAPALVLVLDQFTRNAFRDTPRMFAGDATALATARRIVAEGWDGGYDSLRRWFCYLPFEHSESLDDQRESLRLFGLLRDDPLAGGAWPWAVRHYEVIERFGRYPHRNAILGRPSTAEEEAFLREPGSRF